MDTDHDGPVDYSDFSYQHIDFNHQEAGGNSALSRVTQTFEPLEQTGGLDSNEVAELVAIRVYAVVSGDNFGDVADTAQGSIDFRGAFGVGIDTVSDLLDPGSGILEPRDAGTVLETEDDANPSISGATNDKDEMLYHWDVYNDTPFSSDAGGVGGGGGGSFLNEIINYRELTGRGPVLDANDDLSFVSVLAKNQVSADAEGKIRMTLIWDTAEVDEAGRRFSVPA